MVIRAIPLILAAAMALPMPAQQQGGRVPPVEERITGMTKLDGYFPLYWDNRTGSLWLEIPRFDTDFLLAGGLAAGLGSNDIGLDRGQEAQGRIVSFQRVGPKVLLVQGNESFRSSSANPAERRSVADSFARSVLWGFTVGAESNGRVLVDATGFFLRDGMNAASALRPGAYRVDAARSAFYMDRTKGFPKNTEVEVTLTFANDCGRGRTWRRGTRWRPVLGLGRERDTFGRGRDASGTLLARRTAGQQLPAPRGRSAGRIRRTPVCRLQRAHRRADAEALCAPAPPGEEGPGRGGVATR